MKASKYVAKLLVFFAKYHNTQKLPKLAKCETYVAVTGISYEPVTTKGQFQSQGYWQYRVTPDKKFGIMLILWPISHAHTYPSRFNSLCQHYDCIQFVLPNHPPEVRYCSSQRTFIIITEQLCNSHFRKQLLLFLTLSCNVGIFSIIPLQV